MGMVLSVKAMNPLKNPTHGIHGLRVFEVGNPWIKKYADVEFRGKWPPTRGECTLLLLLLFFFKKREI
jgi:hypothetical protein